MKLTDKVALISSLTNISNAVKELRQVQTSMYGHGLVDDIEQELQTLFRKVELDEDGLS